MAYPTAPIITYSYTGFQAGQGGNLFPGTQMDNDLTTLEVFASSVVDFIKLFANSDGTLKVTAFTDTSVLTVPVATATAAATTATAASASATAASGQAGTFANNASTSASAAAASAATIAAGNYLTAAGNLATIGSASAARTNLGLGTFATKSSIVLSDIPDGVFTADAAGRAKLAAGFVDFSVLPVGSVLQIIDSQTGAVATGTTLIPYDDTIPQQTEGDQYLSATITPRYSTSILEIDVTIQLASSASSGNFVAALFQDAGANALAAAHQTHINIGYNYQLRIRHRMVAGTTSATTFKVRAGSNAAGTTTFNGSTSTRLYGGALASFINIREIKA